MQRIVRFLTATVLSLVATVVGVGTLATPAAADGCYTWGRTLSQGTSGEDVRQLQIRVSGYPGTGAVLALDGAFGPGTKAAVTRFQAAWGLGQDGIAGPQTFAKIYELQDEDCSTQHFNWTELNNCNSTWAGGAVSAATARNNAKVSMWKLEALRKALGGPQIIVTSGFRSVACNNAVGGSSTSRHLYGDAVDMAGTPALCTLARQARNHGFREILGPGYPGHGDHTHVAHKSSQFWSASQCGI